MRDTSAMLAGHCLGESFRPERQGGFIEQRAHQVLGESVDLLRAGICDEGLLTAIAEGTFGITKRPADGGRSNT